MFLVLSALLFLVGSDRPGWFGFGFAYHPPKAGAAQGWVSVESVRPQSPAAEAGLHPGDEIVAINHEPIRFTDDVELLRYVAGFKPGQSVMMSVKRRNEEVVVNVIPAPMNDEQLAAYQQNLEKASHRRPTAPPRPR
jgi:S1-C subfamily serine protease